MQFIVMTLGVRHELSYKLTFSLVTMHTCTWYKTWERVDIFYQRHCERKLAFADETPRLFFTNHERL